VKNHCNELRKLSESNAGEHTLLPHLLDFSYSMAADLAAEDTSYEPVMTAIAAAIDLLPPAA